LIATLALVAGWNTYRYPSGAGYDVAQHRQYADLLIHHGEIPAKGTHTEYYTPPGFYALAGAATVIGEHVHAGDPYKLGQVLNWLVLLAAAGVLWLALVAVVGAATRVGGPADYLNACRFDRSAYNANVIEMPCAGSIIRNADVVVGISAMRLWMCGTDCRPGLSPRP